jgi:hypothetical protein
MTDTFENGERHGKIEATLESLKEQMDRIEKSLNENVDDHEKRIHELEMGHSNLMGKLVIVGAIITIAMPFITGFVLKWIFKN